MPEYMLSVRHDPADQERLAEIPPEAMQKMFADVEAFNDKLRDAGAWVFAGGLEPVETTTTVDNTGAEAIVTDGPFVESKEYLGGFWVISAADLDEALDWAKQGSKACDGRVEVRPFQGE